VQRSRYGAQILQAIKEAPQGAGFHANLAMSMFMSASSQAGLGHRAKAEAAYQKALDQITKVRGLGGHELADLLVKEAEHVRANIDRLAALSPEEAKKYVETREAAEQAHVRYADPATVQAVIAAQDVQAKIARGECVSWLRTPDLCWAAAVRGGPRGEPPWGPGLLKKVLIYGGIGLVAYAFVRGFAEGLAKRR
jgi:hypothetical protein